jgi:hypothetical protein
MATDPAKITALRRVISNNTTGILTVEGIKKLKRLIEVEAVGDLLYDVYVTHGATLNLPVGDAGAETMSDGNVRIPVRRASEAQDEYVIDAIVFEACNSQGVRTRGAFDTVTQGARTGTGGRTKCAAVGVLKGNWEAESMVTYVTVALNVPPSRRTLNMARAVVDWFRAGAEAGRFRTQTQITPHDRNDLRNGIPQTKMGLPTPVLYTYEHICTHKDHTIILKDFLYAVFLCTTLSGAKIQKTGGGTYEPIWKHRGDANAGRTAQLCTWMDQHWPNRNQVQPGGYPARVVFVHDLINACGTLGAPFTNATAAAFGLNNHTEQIALAETPGMPVRVTFP